MRPAKAPIPGAPEIRSADALQSDAMRPLKELFERHHAAPLEYAVEHVTTAPASEPAQYVCRLSCPALTKANGQELVPAATFQAQGRGKHDAEQHCAQQALERLRQAGVAL